MFPSVYMVKKKNIRNLISDNNLSDSKRKCEMRQDRCLRGKWRGVQERTSGVCEGGKVQLSDLSDLWYASPVGWRN